MVVVKVLQVQSSKSQSRWWQGLWVGQRHLQSRGRLRPGVGAQLLQRGAQEEAAGGANSSSCRPMAAAGASGVGGAHPRLRASPRLPRPLGPKRRPLGWVA